MAQSPKRPKNKKAPAADENVFLMMSQQAPLTSSKTLSAKVYLKIREDIVRGKLEPNQKLKLEKLMADYETGMSPLREALSRLVGDMLVKTQGQRGFWVAPLSLKDLDDITNIRSLLETHALSISIQKGDDRWVDHVNDSYEKLASTEKQLEQHENGLPADLAIEWEQNNRVFHSALVSACDSMWLIRLRSIMYQQLERYRRISLASSRGHRDVAEEHYAIYKAVVDRKALRATNLLEMHLNETAREVRAAILENDALSTSP